VRSVFQYLVACLIQSGWSGSYLPLLVPSRCGRRVDYRFYHPLEEILGQEAVSIDEYDEKDQDQDQDQDQEQADQDPGTVVFIHPLTQQSCVDAKSKSVLLTAALRLNQAQM